MSTETIRFIRDGGEGVMAVGLGVGRGDYIPIATLSPPELHVLRWAVMRAILMFH